MDWMLLVENDFYASLEKWIKIQGLSLTIKSMPVLENIAIGYPQCLVSPVVVSNLNISQASAYFPVFSSVWFWVGFKGCLSPANKEGSWV